MTAQDIRKIVDDLLIEGKQIAGDPNWRPTDRDGQFRWLAPLAVQGVISDLTLIVDAYPRAGGLKFTVVLTFNDECIVRVDYGQTEMHNNPVVVPAGVKPLLICGSHHHSWRLNRQLASARALPGELEYAVLLEPQNRGFENVLRWFCGEYNIQLADVPAYPEAELLL